MPPAASFAPSSFAAACLLRASFAGFGSGWTSSFGGSAAAAAGLLSASAAGSLAAFALLDPGVRHRLVLRQFSGNAGGDGLRPLAIALGHLHQEGVLAIVHKGLVAQRAGHVAGRHQFGELQIAARIRFDRARNREEDFRQSGGDRRLVIDRLFAAGRFAAAEDPRVGNALDLQFQVRIEVLPDDIGGEQAHHARFAGNVDAQQVPHLLHVALGLRSAAAGTSSRPRRHLGLARGRRGHENGTRVLKHGRGLAALDRLQNVVQLLGAE